MAATLYSTPSSPGYHRNNNFFEIETDQVDLIPAAVNLDFESTGPVLAETLQIEWAGNSITFTVEAGTNTTATAIPTKSGGETLAEYADRVFEALRQNDLLTTDFYVWRGGTVGMAERVSLRQIVPGELDVTVTNGLTNLTAGVTDGTDPILQDNLSAYVRIYDGFDDPNADTLVATLHAPYDVTTARATFDLKDLFNLAPSLPTGDSIDPSSFSPWPHDVAYGAFSSYYLRYADKYGVPAVSEALIKSGTYYMLAGGHPGDWLAGSAVGNARKQHAYLRADGKTFVKPVGIDQPDWVYLWVNVALTGVRIEIETTWSDGTTTAEDAPSALYDLDAKKLYWFASGPLQHASSLAPGSPDLEPIYYNWRLLADAGAGEVLIAQVRYRIHCGCHPWNMYLMMDNGLGGCESVHVRGRSKWKYEAERDTARRLRWNTHSVALGDMFTFNAEGQQVIEVNTGWHEQYYIEHLRQLLLGDLWLIEVANKRFLRMVCDTKSVDVKEDDQQLYSLTLTLRAAWLDTHYHLNP